MLVKNKFHKEKKKYYKIEPEQHKRVVCVLHSVLFVCHIILFWYHLKITFYIYIQYTYNSRILLWYIYMSMLCMRSSFLLTISISYKKKISKKCVFFLCMEISQLDIDLYSVYLCVYVVSFIVQIYMYVYWTLIYNSKKIINIILIKNICILLVFSKIFYAYIFLLLLLLHCVCVIFWLGIYYIIQIHFNRRTMWSSMSVRAMGGSVLRW